MKHLDTSTFKTTLLAQQAALMEQLAILRGGSVGRAEASTEHFATRDDTPAAANSARDLEFALDAHDTAEIEAVNAALKRIDGSASNIFYRGVGEHCCSADPVSVVNDQNPPVCQSSRRHRFLDV